MATQVAHALVPNVSTSGDSDLQPKATKAFMSFHIVSCAAHAVRNTAVAPIATVETDDADVKATMTKVHAGLADLTTKLDTAKLTADSWTLVAPPCLTALAIALSTASRSPAGSPTMMQVGDGASDTSRSG